MKVGVVMPIGHDEVTGRVPGWAEIRAAAHAAEAAALDSIWVYDHLLFRFGDDPTTGIHEAWTILAALAAETTSPDLGVLVLAMPFRNPALLAKMATTLDEVSGGRLILGVGCGWHEPEFDAFGYPFDHRVGRFEEALGVLLPLVRRGQVTFQGRWHSAVDAQIVPRSPRPEGHLIPILIAGKKPRMLRLVARHADAWNTAWIGPASQLEARMGPLRAALAAEGRDPATLEVTVGVNVVLPAFSDVPREVPADALTGDAATLAAGLREYAELGVGTVIVALEPATPESVAELGRAAALSRG
ncbi:MAG: LLM class flavin-dependent oxidoreductase [Chloroflexota bacterium]|nr:LLM class flavin-dependent oxidoreductase [Chloroflexota bacterium]